MPVLYAFAGAHVRGETTSTNFVAVTGEETAWPPNKPIGYSTIKDPHSSTILFAEYNGPTIHWMSPEDLKFSTMSFKVGDPAGIDSQYLAPAVATVNGTVQRLSESMTPDQLRAMCTANGNEDEPKPDDMQEMQDGRLRPLKNPNAEAADEKNNSEE